MVALAPSSPQESYAEPSPYAWLRSRTPIPTTYAPACEPLYPFLHIFENRTSRARGMTGSCAEVVERTFAICIEIWQFELESCVWRVSFHKYAYVHGDPVNAIDPTGMFWQSLYVQVKSAAVNLGVLASVSARLLATQIVIQARLILTQLSRTPSALVTRIQRFFWDSRSFQAISRQYWKPWKEFGGAQGQSLHHWLIPQRWGFPQGLQNAGFNLLTLPKILPGRLGLNQWMGFAVRWGGTRGVVAVGVENGIRIAVPLAAAAAANVGFRAGNEFGETMFLGDSATAREIKLDSTQQHQLQQDASNTVDEAIAELEEYGEEN
jgi:hypothetical protein